jgi:PAS domain S-box-containing protein
MKRRLNSMTASLAIGITAAVAIACGLGAYLYSLHHFNTLLETARTTALSQSELIRVALEHQMIENDRSLIGRMIESFGREPGVEAVVLLDRQGLARYSSVPLAPGNDLTIGSKTCQSCHNLPPEQRTSSRVIETRGGTLLRTVVPIRNREACYGCHDPSHRINGILIVDTDAGRIRAGMNRDLRWMVAGSVGLMLLLVTAIGLVVRHVVMRRLQRFEVVARQIAAGDLERRVPVDGSDIVSWLAHEFNAMADSTTSLLGEVRHQREQLETVINSIDDGIVVLDPERKVIAANDAFLRRTGCQRDEVLGCSCHEMRPDMCGPSDCPTLACLATSERQIRICEHRTAGGETTWEEVHSSPVLGPSGAIIQVVEVWRDISRRRAAEAQLAESHRLASLGMLASGFSHELNTPLATALVCVEAILREARAEDRTGRTDEAEWSSVGENAGIAREQLLRCGGITRHFLRLSTGRASPTDLVDVGAALDAVVRLITPAARDHATAIEVEPVVSGTRVRADEAELQHVLLNLLLNAIQACGPGGTVRMEVAVGEPVRIRIMDNGCGIVHEEQAKIFEPFYSLRHGGTGLGLFLSLNFVRRWGGDIQVRSTPGIGSTFEVSLPSAATDDPASEDSP